MEDSRCCGSGTCIINADGYCWCGQRWDGEKMCFEDKPPDAASGAHQAVPPDDPPAPS